MEKKNELLRKLETLKQAGIKTIDDLIELMDFLPEGKATPTESREEFSLEVKVKTILHRLGVPAHVKGYQYLTDAIIMGIEDKENLEYITKVLYPNVAKKNHTTATRVERAIRHAIEVLYNRGNIELLEKLFGFSVNPEKGRPTNSEFICAIVDHIRMGTI